MANDRAVLGQAMSQNSVILRIGAWTPKDDGTRSDLKKDRRVEAGQLSSFVFELNGFPARRDRMSQLWKSA